MNDIVISARISSELLAQLKKFGKSNTDLVNEALNRYIQQNTLVNHCIPDVYEKGQSDEYKTIDDQVLLKIHRFCDNLIMGGKK